MNENIKDIAKTEFWSNIIEGSEFWQDVFRDLTEPLPLLFRATKPKGDIKGEEG